MPIFIAALIGGLAQAVEHLVGRVLIALGIGYVAYSGIDTLVAATKTEVLAAIGGLSATTVQVVGMLQVGTAINIIASALVARLAIRGLSSGVVKKAITK